MPNEVTHRDKILLQRLCDGDERAFTQLYNTYIAELTGFIVKFVKLPQIAEDISQEVFIKIWQNHAQLQGVDSFKAYLFVAARNHTLNILKRIAKEDSAKAEIIRHFQSIRVNNKEDDLISGEYLAYLRNVLNSLPMQTQQVFQLCRTEQKGYEEVAALLGISRNTVKKHMVRSMKTFRHALENGLGIPLPLIIIHILSDKL